MLPKHAACLTILKFWFVLYDKVPDHKVHHLISTLDEYLYKRREINIKVN